MFLLPCVHKRHPAFKLPYKPRADIECALTIRKQVVLRHGIFMLGHQGPFIRNIELAVIW